MCFSFFFTLRFGCLLPLFLVTSLTAFPSPSEGYWSLGTMREENLRFLQFGWIHINGYNGIADLQQNWTRLEVFLWVGTCSSNCSPMKEVNSLLSVPTAIHSDYLPVLALFYFFSSKEYFPLYLIQPPE